MLTTATEYPVKSQIFLFEPLEEKHFNYTAEGIKRLSILIQATLKARKWSLRTFAKQADIAPSTASKYINAKITKPEDKILKAIAPLIYKPVSFADKIYIDKNSTYSDWTELAYVATKDFFQENIMNLQEIIESTITKNNLSESDIETELLSMVQNKTASMTINRFMQIQKGLVNDVTEDELRQIRVLLDIDEEAHTESEWIMAFLEQKNPSSNQRQGFKIDELDGAKN
ncbi:helix-turn-helix domain-containing protein [Anabaena lutea]|uniref:Helix-turn-helix transcriptional regulator n=1 Tax=Anabaena lutea FACHB-196 TaxID=2692881 RepID=A0ABR8FJR4_9NOST|nr:helix-turn-helix transcriptional regulator [Anabaena lutea]MBD2570021.1 helix-turn-helix transcriptional regulator [Anabaena lutea FACHB-196]